MKSLQLFVLALISLIGSAPADELKPVNVKYMLYASCHAGSRPDKDAAGGYGQSDNLPRKIKTNLGAPDAISLLATPDTTVPLSKTHQGFSLYLINRTGKEVAFYASDSRLSIVCEALDEKGQWRPIEELLHSWCGNSNHHVFLPQNHYWQFTVPAYTGSYATRLRFTLDSKPFDSKPPIHSNEFEGKINPAQFTKKKSYNATNLMDPYDN